MKLLTADIYWNSLDLKARALRSLEPQARFDLAVELAKQGYRIDRAIMLDQAMLPQDVMAVRLANGFTWVPAANQPNIPTMPGDDMPGQTPYDPAHPPAGSIPVSVDAADYPPFGGEQPTPVAKPSVGESFVTAKGHIFLPGIGLNQNLIAEGQTVTQDSVAYLAHVNWMARPPIYFTIATVQPAQEAA